jgi:hypothetical protein
MRDPRHILILDNALCKSFLAMTWNVTGFSLKLTIFGHGPMALTVLKHIPASGWFSVVLLKLDYVSVKQNKNE